MSISFFEVNMLKLFSAEYIENICALWEFGGSWILNFRKKVLTTLNFHFYF